MHEFDEFNSGFGLDPSQLGKLFDSNSLISQSELNRAPEGSLKQMSLAEFGKLSTIALKLKMEKYGATVCMVVGGDEKGEGNVFFVPQERQVTIGRNPGNDIELKVNHVSRKHAKVAVSPTETGFSFEVEDTKSSNGTVFEDKPIQRGTKRAVTSSREQAVRLGVGNPYNPEVIYITNPDALPVYGSLSREDWERFPDKRKAQEMAMKRIVPAALAIGNEIVVLRETHNFIGYREDVVSSSQRLLVQKSMISSENSEVLRRLGYDQIALVLVAGGEIQSVSVGIESHKLDPGSEVELLEDLKVKPYNLLEGEIKPRPKLGLKEMIQIDGETYEVDFDRLFGEASDDLRGNPEKMRRMAQELMADYHKFKRYFKRYVGKEGWDEELYQRAAIVYSELWKSYVTGEAGAYYPGREKDVNKPQVKLTEDYLGVDGKLRKLVTWHEFLHHYAFQGIKTHPNVEEGIVHLLAAAAVVFEPGEGEEPDLGRWNLDDPELEDFISSVSPEEYKQRALVMLEFAKKMRNEVKTLTQISLQSDEPLILAIAERFGEGRNDGGLWILNDIEEHLRSGQYREAEEYIKRLDYGSNAPETIFRPE